MPTIYGHAAARGQLEHAIATDQVRHAYLVAGPDGVGKTVFAQAFAQALVCRGRDASNGKACGECTACRKVEHGNHPDITLVTAPAGKRWLDIDSIRAAVRTANLAPAESAHRVIIIPHAHEMLGPSANALLKTLEEPPEGVVVVLTCSEPGALLSTIVSRCQTIALHPLVPQEIAAALTEGWGVDAEEARELAAIANGRLGWAIQAHQDPALRTQRDEEIAALARLTAAPVDERLRHVSTMGKDTESARHTLDLWIQWWRDVTLAATGASHLSLTGRARAEAERQGRMLGPDAAFAFLRALVDAHVALDSNANPKLTLEVLMLDVPELPERARAR